MIIPNYLGSEKSLAVFGRLILEDDGQEEMDVSGLNPGMYIVEVQTPAKIYHRRILKQ